MATRWVFRIPDAGWLSLIMPPHDGVLGRRVHELLAHLAVEFFANIASGTQKSRSEKV